MFLLGLLLSMDLKAYTTSWKGITTELFCVRRVEKVTKSCERTLFLQPIFAKQNMTYIKHLNELLWKKSYLEWLVHSNCVPGVPVYGLWLGQATCCSYPFKLAMISALYSTSDSYIVLLITKRGRLLKFWSSKIL